MAWVVGNATEAGNSDRHHTQQVCDKINQDTSKADGERERRNTSKMSTDTFNIVISDRGVHAPCRGRMCYMMVGAVHRGERYMLLRAVLCRIIHRGGDAP